MSIQTIRFGGSDYSLETLGNLSGPELVKLHNNCAGLTGLSETKRFSDKSSALKRTWAVLQAYGEQGHTTELPAQPTPDIQEPHVTPAPELPEERDAVTPSAGKAEASPKDKHNEEQPTMASAARKKATPAKTAKAHAEPVARGFAEDAKIKVLVKENPRRGAAAERFEIYKTGMTVAEFSKKIGSRAEALVHLRWDVNKGHISVG